MAAAAIVPGRSSLFPGLGMNPTRTGLVDIMKDMGADMSVENPRSGGRRAGGRPDRPRRRRSGASKSGAEISGRAIDELPLVALLGAFAEGDTVVSGAAELSLKESDRIALLAQNLTAVGVDIEPRPDGFVVHGGSGVAGGSFKSMGDHRMAMMGAVAGVASGSGVDVVGFGCVSVSFPSFEDSLGGCYESLVFRGIPPRAGD